MANPPKGIGTGHHLAKMTNAKVRQARKSYATGKLSQATLAAKYGISNTAMRAILMRATWKHVA